ncbi:MAG: hypothetical protein NZM43_06735 [Saprospiraceae bacterium]|nr:hypothetical protein [Saprospiraceae bacterium]MDW8484007.1 hypothetical protein [Saprospiraceae bacterium]
MKKIKAEDLKALKEQGYSSACYTYEYGGVDQHWVVYHSQSAASQEATRLEKKMAQERYKAEMFRHNLFILAANPQVHDPAEEEQLLRMYREQHSIERGFRFIKDPNLVASSFFAQKPERVAALAFVMTTCLLVYSALEYRIRQALQKQDKTVSGQKGQPSKKTCYSWVFPAFCGHSCARSSRRKEDHV